jgi:hypothetical protein
MQGAIAKELNDRGITRRPMGIAVRDALCDDQGLPTLGAEVRAGCLIPPVATTISISKISLEPIRGNEIRVSFAIARIQAAEATR